MAASLNGWPGLPSRDSRLASGLIPGTRSYITCNRDVLPLFLALGSDINRKVIAVDGGLGPDGYQYREARTGAGLSNHASGTAVDFRYDVFKADHGRHASAAQIAACHAILDLYRTSSGKRILGWGGDWRVGQYCDEMHWEIGQAWEPGVGSPVTLRDVRNVIDRLGITQDGLRAGASAGGGKGKPVIIPGRPVPSPLTGLKVVASTRGRLTVAWAKGANASSWEVTTDQGTHVGIATIPACRLWGLKPGPVTVWVTPRNSANHGVRAGIRTIVK